jgi:hypothetical protein
LTPFEEDADDGAVGEPSRQTSATRRFTAADGVVLAAAAAFLGLSLVPGWYRVGGGEAFGIPLPSYTLNAWRGTTMFAAFLAILGLAWIGLRAGRVSPRVGVEPSVVDAALAGLCLLLTVLGTMIRPDTGLGRASPSWALSVAIIAAVVWLYGALRRYREARTAGASSWGSGFTGERRP